jgi:cell division protein ZipA
VPELRWILLALGVVAVVGIYLWSRRKGEVVEDEFEPGRREPVLDDRRPPWDLKQAGQPVPEPGADKDPAAEAGGESLIVVLRVRSRGPGGFAGGALSEFFAEENLKHGQLGAFHSLDLNGRPRFMVANLTEPGSFDPEAMQGQIIPGVSLFMVLPGPADPPSTLDEMLGFARRLAKRFGGEVLDENGNALTGQEAGYLREKVVEYWRRTRISGAAP